MSVKQTLSLRTQTRLALTPQMRQSLDVLRMTAVELQEMAVREAGDNPFLRLRGGAGRGGGSFDLALATIPSRPGMIADIIHQIRFRTLPDDVREAAEYLAGTLRDDGYLEGDLAELAADLGMPESLLEAGLVVLQSCEPAGIGARNLGECILLQLIDEGMERGLAQRAVGSLAELASGRLASAARAMEVTLDEAARIAALLRGVDPHPVKPEAEMATILRPDLSVRRAADGMLSVALARELPVLEFDRRLGAGEFAAARRLRAEALIAAVNSRNATLLAIGRAIVARQQAFFHAGPDALVPLTRAELAGELGLHPSTLGRAVMGKGLETGGRIVPLSLFFSSSLAAGEGETVSAVVVSRRIARMIAAEPAGAPLADADIARRLAEEGVDIARRTVAKYREGLKIPSSRRRRRAGARKGGGG